MFKKSTCKNLIFINDKDKKEIIMGIYGIMVNDEIVYIGQSTDIVKRCKQHALKIVKPIENCQKFNNDFLPVYIKLREYYYTNINIKFVILERVNKKEYLKDRELYYINKYNPKLVTHYW